MEFTKEKMRFYIFMRCKLGESAKLIHETLQTVFGDCACSYQNVCRLGMRIEHKIIVLDCKQLTSNREFADRNDNLRSNLILNGATTQSLRELGIQVLPHPAYSPDVAPCDFWMFPILKDRLAGRKFDRIQDLAKAVNSELQTITEEDYQGVFRKWHIRLKRCIERHGEYSKGL
ncbi:transposase [Elysia marginata]|uniref:Transposase n=1 Tax=Elysia marginata TaxID=1093978 RepID=A0AAV4FES2_9GAST|nr:transposase [Elysia marginata]